MTLILKWGYYTIALIHMIKVKYWMTFNWTVDGIDLIGDTPWDCINVFFSGTGEMKKRYGFIYVDIDNTEHGTMNCSKKKLSNWRKRVIKTNNKD